MVRAAVYLGPAIAATRVIEAVVFGLRGEGASQITTLTISRGLIAIVLLGLAALYILALDRRSPRTLGLWFYRGWGRELASGAAIGFLLMALTVGVLVVGRAVVYQGFSGGAAASLVILLRVGVLFLAAGALEEILFRGYGFQRLADSIGSFGAVAVMSAYFGAEHFFNPSATVLSTANTVLAGVLLSVAYLRTRALWLPIGLHWAWNFFQGEVFSLPVSGIRFGLPLLQSISAGPAWLTGGNYGPEGGLAMTVVGIAGIVWLARTKSLRPSPAMLEVLE